MAVLLRVVIGDLTRLKTCLEEWCHRCRGKKPDPLVMEVLRMYGRAEQVLREFSGFYCLRLVLDKQSPLATYFMDFFCQMFWITQQFLVAPLPQPTDHTQHFFIYEELWDEAYSQARLSDSPPPRFSKLEMKQFRSAVERLLWSLQPVVQACFDLYVACQLSPTARSKWLQEKGELRREARVDRMFSENKLHCSMRSMGFVNLDGHTTKVRLVEEELGEGASCKVYKGYFEMGDPGQQIGRPVAVKMFGGAGSSNSSNGTIQSATAWYTRMEHITKQAGIARLDPRDEELRRLVSLGHPNIVNPIGYIGKRGHFGESGLVMELMDRSLYDFLEKVRDRKEAPLGELEMIDVMLEIARGMRFVHECGFMHRDLKPGNVLLRVTRANSKGNSDESLEGEFEFAEVKLADFGITKDILSHHDELHTAPAGTNYYMAPEVRQSGTSGTERPYTDKADVFSYGTTCFNILIGDPGPDAYLQTSETGCGRREQFYGAVERGEWKEWVQQLQQHDRPPMPDYLVDLIERCWQTEPSSRPTFASICLLLDVVKQSQLSRAPVDSLFPSQGVVPFSGTSPKSVRKIRAGKQLIRTVLQDFDTDNGTGKVEEVINKLRTDGMELVGELKKLDKKKVAEVAVEAVLKPASLASRALLFNSMGKRFPSAFSNVDYAANRVDFSSDEASTELDEDPSMIPLFVCFCSPFFSTLEGEFSLIFSLKLLKRMFPFSHKFEQLFPKVEQALG